MVKRFGGHFGRRACEEVHLWKGAGEEVVSRHYLVISPQTGDGKRSDEEVRRRGPTRGGEGATMPCILSPDWKLHRIPDDKTEAAAAVAKLVKELNIGWRLAGNLRQLCGVDVVGTDRTQRKEASGWKLLSLPRWLRHDESNIFFIVSGDLTKAFAKMPELAASGISFSMFKKILNGELKEKAGWRRHEQPAFVETLSDGASLAGPIIDYQHQRVEIVPVEQRGAAVPPRQVRAHGSRRVGGWVAAS